MVVLSASCTSFLGGKEFLRKKCLNIQGLVGKQLKAVIIHAYAKRHRPDAGNSMGYDSRHTFMNVSPLKWIAQNVQAFGLQSIQ